MLSEARAEAWKRYDGDRTVSEITGEEESHDDWGYAETAREAFVAGAQWQAQRPFTEEDVEAAAKALAFADENPWDSMTDTEQWAYMADARAALGAVTARHAALGGRTNGDGDANPD